jgi:hypothetical protein
MLPALGPHRAAQEARAAVLQQQAEELDTVMDALQRAAGQSFNISKVTALLIETASAPRCALRACSSHMQQSDPSGAARVRQTPRGHAGRSRCGGKPFPAQSMLT